LVEYVDSVQEMKACTNIQLGKLSEDISSKTGKVEERKTLIRFCNQDILVV